MKKGDSKSRSGKKGALSENRQKEGIVTEEEKDKD